MKVQQIHKYTCAKNCVEPIFLFGQIPNIFHNPHYLIMKISFVWKIQPLLLAEMILICIKSDHQHYHDNHRILSMIINYEAIWHSELLLNSHIFHISPLVFDISFLIWWTFLVEQSFHFIFSLGKAHLSGSFH